MSLFASSQPTSSHPVVNIAAYKFVALADLSDRRRELKTLCDRLGLKGTILLSSEGINLFLAGSRGGVDGLLGHLKNDPAFAGLEVKESLSQQVPFNRMLVRLKREIIAFGVPVNPEAYPAPKLSPAELKQWLDEGRPVTLLDTRNDYEVHLGTFENALDLQISHFRDFPQAIDSLPEDLKGQPVVMFCTGGIRCEKAGPLMRQAGFQQVFQLEGGILKYFEECGGDHWEGECFVFDQRVALNPRLQETETTQCFACQAVLTVADQSSQQYIPGQSCPHCFATPQQQLRRLLQRRTQRIRELVDPLPGSVAYDNQRMLNVPQRFDRWRLLDFLDAYHPQVGRLNWQQRCDQGQLLHQHQPASADRIVRAGERFVLLEPAIVEPEVSVEIDILHEDEALVVVNKPAPLPVHPSGRFNRNTLVSILNEVYAPQRLRPAHRLDANTSGVLVLSRTRSIASMVQPQFAARAVSKIYATRVQGHPAWETYCCEVPLSDRPSQVGLRLPDPHGLPAKTEFRVMARLPDGTALLQAQPITGRTNQIRVHLWHLNFPICNDPAYLPQGRQGKTQTLDPAQEPLQLHAWQIELTHPCSGERQLFEAPLPSWANSQLGEDVTVKAQ